MDDTVIWGILAALRFDTETGLELHVSPAVTAQQEGVVEKLRIGLSRDSSSAALVTAVIKVLPTLMALASP
ncbi:hypothetical protein ACW2Q0_20195 [Nocardia sp. R16R-3T]